MESCLANAAVFGVASDEVNLARDLVSGKNKDDGLFICEGLWAADKLVDGGFIIEQFVFCTRQYKPHHILRLQAPFQKNQDLRGKFHLLSF